MTARFNIRREADGWLVFDEWTGLTVGREDGSLLAALDFEDADDFADLLSRAHERGLADFRIE
ncbi:hypothetical protein [Phenylobacterium sp. 58.2.17]|uniref:hypothetical protein n=1 Tax=Phenylobacterium sp. 58.2.17 TaxID=2969306 RepID=UPI0022649670|nr:hypothetical protein [Phenylobacterium sp. 58.2.17]MCX7585058.1 hypothetical protein [Phenylobacterium sp. 58.2.17]